MTTPKFFWTAFPTDLKSLKKCWMKLMTSSNKCTGANSALAIWRGDEYILSFLFATQLQFRQTNKAEQQNKQWAFVSLISSGTGQTEHRIPPHRQCFNVMCHPIQHPAHIQSPMILPPDPTLFLAHGKAHKTPTQSQPCQELKMPTHSLPTPADITSIIWISHFDFISPPSKTNHYWYL